MQKFNLKKLNILLFFFTFLIAQNRGIASMNKINSIDIALQNEAKNLPFWTIFNDIIKHNALGEYFSTDQKKFALIKSASFYTYLLGELDDATLCEVKKTLDAYQNVTLICNTRYHKWFLDHGYQLSPCIELSFDANSIKTPAIPEPFSIKDIDATTFPHCQWYNFMSSIYGNPERFLSNCFGVALYDGDKIVCEVYAAFADDKFYEIGIATHPDYRGQGLATLTAAYLIKKGLDRNLTPVWSCDCDNIGSWKTALKLGFSVKSYSARLKKIVNVVTE